VWHENESLAGHQPSPAQMQSSLSGSIGLLSGLWLDDWFASTDSAGSAALPRTVLSSTVALLDLSGSIATLMVAALALQDHETAVQPSFVAG
jgi:hypothetical protein